MQLFEVYNSIDLEKSGRVLHQYIFESLNVEKSWMMNKLIGFLDENGYSQRVGEFNFIEYVCIIWMFLAATPINLGSFVYAMIDKQRQGSVEDIMIKKFVRSMHMKTEESVIAGLEEIIDNCKHNNMSIDISEMEFIDMVRAHVTLLRPLLVLQSNLQNHVINQPFWDKQCRRRLLEPENMYAKYIYKVMDELSLYNKKLKVEESISIKKNTEEFSTSNYTMNNNKRRNPRSYSKRTLPSRDKLLVESLVLKESAAQRQLQLQKQNSQKKLNNNFLILSRDNLSMRSLLSENDNAQVAVSGEDSLPSANMSSLISRKKSVRNNNEFFIDATSEELTSNHSVNTTTNNNNNKRNSFSNTSPERRNSAQVAQSPDQSKYEGSGSGGGGSTLRASRPSSINSFSPTTQTREDSVGPRLSLTRFMHSAVIASSANLFDAGGGDQTNLATNRKRTNSMENPSLSSPTLSPSEGSPSLHLSDSSSPSAAPRIQQKNLSLRSRMMSQRNSYHEDKQRVIDSNDVLKQPSKPTVEDQKKAKEVQTRRKSLDNLRRDGDNSSRPDTKTLKRVISRRRSLGNNTLTNTDLS